MSENHENKKSSGKKIREFLDNTYDLFMINRENQRKYFNSSEISLTDKCLTYFTKSVLSGVGISFLIYRSNTKLKHIYFFSFLFSLIAYYNANKYLISELNLQKN